MKLKSKKKNPMKQIFHTKCTLVLNKVCTIFFFKIAWEMDMWNKLKIQKQSLWNTSLSYWKLLIWKSEYFFKLDWYVCWTHIFLKIEIGKIGWEIVEFAFLRNFSLMKIEYLRIIYNITVENVGFLKLVWIHQTPDEF